MSTHELEPHPLCLMFPEMTPEAYAGLVKSVREHGAMKPVVMHEDKVLDGWHRYRAYMEVGVPFDVVDWDGEYGTPFDYVVAENFDRRDLTPSQRAALAVEFKRHIEAETRALVGGYRPSTDESVDHSAINCEMVGRDARAEAADRARVNHQYVSDAERIEEASPETFAEVRAGLKSIPQAKRELGLAKPKPKAKPKVDDDCDPWPDVPNKPNAVANGVPVYDPEVARLKALGKIPDGVTAVIDDPEDAETFAEAMESFQEDQIEAAAKVDDLKDEEWLAALPLTSRLEGRPLELFRRDAIHYRRMEGPRRALLDANGRAAADAYRGASHRRGEGYVQMRVSAVTRMDHPRDWVRCAATEHGGCGGSGMVEAFGTKCGECWGRGYKAR